MNCLNCASARRCTITTQAMLDAGVYCAHWAAPAATAPPVRTRHTAPEIINPAWDGDWPDWASKEK